MNYLNDALNELEDIDEDWEDFNDPDWIPPTEEEEAFAKEIFDMLQAEIDKNELINENNLFLNGCKENNNEFVLIDKEYLLKDMF